MSSQRIQITRTQLVAQFIEVSNPPAILEETFQKPPFCHLLSKYVIRPVACDQKPFFIHHKNKQQILVAQPFAKKKFNKKNQGECDDLDAPPKEEQVAAAESSDDEFETVTGESKREANKKKIAEAPVVEANPLFPASDPGRVKVIEHKKKDPAAAKEKKDQKQKAKDQEGDAKADPVEPVKQAPAAKEQAPKAAPVPKVKLEKALAVAKSEDEWTKGKAPASARGAAKKEDKPFVRAKNEENKGDVRAATARAPAAAKKPKADTASNDIFAQFKIANDGGKQEVKQSIEEPAKVDNTNKGKGGKKEKTEVASKEEVPKKAQKQKQTENKEQSKKPAQEKKAPQEEQKEVVKPKSAKPAAASKDNILQQNKKDNVQKAAAPKIDDIIKTQEKQAKKQIEEKKVEMAKIDPFDFKAQMELGNKMSDIQSEANKEKRALKAQKKGKGGDKGGAAASKPAAASTTKKAYTQQKTEFELMMEKR